MKIPSGKNVHIKNQAKTEELIKKIIEEGNNKLQVVADFDNTLSRYTLNGKRCDTCHNALDESKRMPDFYRSEAQKIRDIYYPIEVDPERSIPDKIPHMVEWEGCDWTFRHLHENSVPLLIFSAGIGDVIEEVIQQQCEMYSNMKVVSNYMEFNEQGDMVGFQGELIHTFNKNESGIHRSDYFERLRGRSNVILLGDSLGDLRMADGAASNANVVLKIGFLNDKVEQRLDDYMNSYDIVLTDDETLDVVNAILKETM